MPMTYDDDVILEPAAAGDLAAGERVRLLLQGQPPVDRETFRLTQLV